MADADKIKTTDSVDKVWVKFADDMKESDERPIGEGETVFVIRGKTDDGEIKDNWGNKFETTEYRIAVTADKTAPEVTELSVAAEDELKVVFSEGVKKFDKDNVEIYDADGKAIDGVSVSVKHEKDNKEWKINLGKKLAGKTIVVKIKDVEDQALQANRMATYTATLTITDKTAPEVTKVTMRVSDDGKTAVLYVTFSEDVDSTTALDKANYALIQGGKLTLLSKDPAFFDGNKVVKLELTESEYTELKKAGTGLFVQRVKDLAGNAMAGMTETSILAYDDPGNAPKIEKIEVVAADRVLFTMIST